MQLKYTVVNVIACNICILIVTIQFIGIAENALE